MWYMIIWPSRLLHRIGAWDLKKDPIRIAETERGLPWLP